MSRPTGSRTTQTKQSLRRDVNVWGAIGVSLALLAPSMAANLTPQAAASSVGRAVPLVFAAATVGVLLISWTFVRLSQRFHHAGSVYGFVGATLGSRIGVVAGWALIGVYLLFAVITSAAVGIFSSALLDATGVWSTPPDWASFLFSALALIAVAALAARPVKVGSRALLGIEGVTVGLILVVTLVVLVRLLTHHAPGGHTFSWSVFSVPTGTPITAVFLGVVYGFLAFAGFEAAATLGEETESPKRAIPQAILGTVVFAGGFFILVTAVEVSAFGADADGVQALTSSGSLLGDLGSQYVAGWVGDLITAGVIASAFGSALASVTGASRLVFALSRDGFGPARLADISERHHVPTRAVLTVVGATAIVGAVAAAIGLTPFEIFADGGSVGVLILLITYALATIGAVRLLFFGPGRGEVARWEIVVPVAGLVVLAYTLFRNVVPYPIGDGAWFPILALLWLVVGVALVLARPEAARRAGAALARSDGLNSKDTATPA
ncbi:APC family permease [Mycolicibacterium komossense]|uniref:APC family permease n=1 Tax=Mycolicibacterium komossense TaxID=1779 RepID=A0ABT3C7X6_9MYCO|nr:APC family permease [Mycolicibacterium komossense]MCV7225545.1 APC family permease [Mycolicibacterium komossense]